MSYYCKIVTIFDNMILRATFRNIYSFKDETSISFIAGKSDKLPEHLIRAKNRDDISVLKASAIYGANASGKSNTIKSIDILKKIATTGLKTSLYHPFKMVDSAGGASKIELEIKVANKYYAYGIEYTMNGIQEEWLYEINKRTEQEIFTRKLISEKYSYSFPKITSSENRQFIQFLSEGTPSDKSFLSEYKTRNGRGIDPIKNVLEWFSKLKIIFPDYKYQGLSFKLKNKEFKNIFNKYLCYFNTGITQLDLSLVKKENVDLPQELIEKVENDLKESTGVMVSSTMLDSYYFERKGADGTYNIYKLITIHQLENGNNVSFEMKEESDGSIRLFDFIPMLIDIKENNSVYLIDEIDRSLHAKLSMAIFEIYSKILGKKNLSTQLICTTHESNLLSLKDLREDEIWFAEKDNTGATHFTSLSEYKYREINKQKGYLNGRYGAIPFFGNFEID